MNNLTAEAKELKADVKELMDSCNKMFMEQMCESGFVGIGEEGANMLVMYSKYTQMAMAAMNLYVGSIEKIEEIDSKLDKIYKKIEHQEKESE